MFRYLVLAVLALPAVLALRPLPESPAPFAATGEPARRFDGEYFTDLFSYYHGGSHPVSLRYTRGNWRCGEKTLTSGVSGDDARNDIGARHSVVVLLRGRYLARVTFGGSSGAAGKDGGWGVPYADLGDEPPEAIIDESGKAFGWRKPYKDAKGVRRVFTWTVNGMGNAKFRLDWDRGMTEEEARGQAKALPLLFLKFNTDNPRLVTVRDGCATLRADEPCEGVSFSGLDGSGLAFGKPAPDHTGNCVELRADLRDKQARGSVLIDLLESRTPRGTPPPVGGIDFWAEDATHVPLRPTRNLLPNPSFEEGLRYWRWDTHSGMPLKALRNGVERVDLGDEGYEGSHALRFPLEGDGAAINSFPISLPAGKRFVFSFYAKKDGDLKDRRQVRVLLYSPTRRSATEFGKAKPKAFELTTAWERYACVYESDGTGLVISLKGCGVAVDALQLEEGEKETEWIGDPVTAVLRTSDRDNTLRNDAPWKAALELSAEAGTDVAVRCRVGNVYREELFAMKRRVTVSADGRTTIPLDFDGHDFGNGVFALRTDFVLPRVMDEATGRPKTWTTYQRFERLRPLDGTNPTRHLVATLTSDFERLGRTEYIWRRWREWGIGGTTWGRSNAYEAAERSLRLEGCLAAGIRNFFRPTDEHEEIRGNKAKGIPEYKDWDEVTPEREKMIEETAYRIVSAADPRLFEYWGMGNEEEGSHLVRLARGQTRIGEEYSKAQLAARRGILRANPKAKVLPTCGPCNFWPTGYAREGVEAYIREAALKGVKWDAIAIHPYGLLDGSTIGHGDLDEAIRALIGIMDKYEYSPSTPIILTESFNSVPQVIKEWGSSPNGDWYQSGHAGYDFSQRELVYAGGVVRTYLMALKFWPRLKTVNTWLASFQLDPSTVPYAHPPAINGFSHRLPDVEFVGNANPYPSAFAYVFRRKTDGKGVAACWTSDNAVEYGMRKGMALLMKLPEDTVAFDAFDNRRAIRRVKGVSKIPLTPLPLYLEAPDALALFEAAKAAGRDAESIRREQEAAKPAKNVLTVRADYRRDRDWSGIAPVELDRAVGYLLGRKSKFISGRDDFSAQARIAWDEKSLRLRIDAKDNDFLIFPEKAAKDPERAKTQLYAYDGCLEVYFDCRNNGKSNVMNDYDIDDYRYDFAPPVDGKDGPGRVWRLVEVDHQQAGGLDMPTKEKAARDIPCRFFRTADGFAYEIEFPAAYLLPMELKEGATVGFGLYLHDRDTDRPIRAEAGVTLMNDYGGVCDHNPKGWAQLRLVK